MSDIKWLIHKLLSGMNFTQICQKILHVLCANKYTVHIKHLQEFGGWDGPNGPMTILLQIYGPRWSHRTWDGANWSSGSGGTASKNNLAVGQECPKGPNWPITKPFQICGPRQNPRWGYDMQLKCSMTFSIVALAVVSHTILLLLQWFITIELLHSWLK